MFFHFQLRHYPPTPFNYVASQVQLQRVAASSSSLAMKALVCDSGQRPAWWCLRAETWEPTNKHLRVRSWDRVLDTRFHSGRLFSLASSTMIWWWRLCNMFTYTRPVWKHSTVSSFGPVRQGNKRSVASTTQLFLCRCYWVTIHMSTWSTVKLISLLRSNE